MQHITTENTHQLVPLQSATRGWISDLAWSPNGSLLACASAGGVAIWRGKVEGKQAFIKGHNGPVKGVAFAPNGTTLATCSADTTVKIWDLRAYSPRMTPITTYQDFQDSVESIIFLRTGAILAGSVNGTVDLLQPDNTSTRIVTHKDELISIAVNQDQTLLASGGRDNLIYLTDLRSFEHIATIGTHTDWIRVLKFHPSRNILMSASRDSDVCVWDLAIPSKAKKLSTFRHEGDVRAATFDASGSLIATGSADHKVRLWNIETKEQLTLLSDHTKPVIAMDFHPQNNLLASGGGDNRILIWGLAST